ncbi:MAG TPA: PilC/PilY family type IV pilus protein [Ramlibacter sp.]|jgi:type IV pilus assembly protein PilY1|uniref:pilus assembly protein n=1 Tax=Ramlibacter sp. TaxID=1917967 RepID=UPI002D22FE88|nr:PilC/PilY family type IV pilus protein [Ramlibacter sp.]HZY19500.1 PilC/PilY family type IV pilus protein [Ramlibacter sp.]
MKRFRPSHFSALLQHLLAALLVTAAGTALPASTDIANAPLFTSSTSLVKPNILFVLDDSGSMGWDYLPDVSNFADTKYGKLSSQCNGVAYNPAITYLPPLNADGTSKPDATFSESDPIAQTTDPRTLNGTITMPAARTTTRLTVRVTTNNRNKKWYDADTTVTVYQDGDRTRFFTGDVVSWSASTGDLVLDLSSSFIKGTGTFSAPRIGTGQPVPTTYYRYNKYTGSPAPLSYTYTSSGVIRTTTFYKECDSVIGAPPGNAVFTAVTVTNSSTAQEKKNFANWMLYYSTRMKMMKSSISLAFKDIDAKYRIGFTNIHNATAESSTDFLDIADFDAGQKAAFYTAVEAAGTGGNTPLRGALSFAGRYFAKKAPGQVRDPMQYSCQRNYTILSTDGYWNVGNESPTQASPLPDSGTAGVAASNFGPFKLDNLTVVGQQDGGATLRPMYDGGNETVTTTETWTTTRVDVRTDMTPRTRKQVVTTRDDTVTAKAAGAEWQNLNIFVPKSFTLAGSNMTRNAGVVTVTIAGGHGFVTGDTIKVSGGSGTGSSTFNNSSTTVTVLSSTSFRYNVSSTSGTATGGGTYTFEPAVSASCNSGQGVYRTFKMVKNADFRRADVSTTTTTPSTSTVTVTTTTRTSYTHTTVVTNGVQTSDTTTNTAPQVTSSTSSATVTTGTATSSSSSTTVASYSGTSAFTPAVAPTTSGCVTSSSVPATTTTPFTGTVTIASVPSSPNSDNTTNGAVVSTPVSSDTTESAHTTTSNTTKSGGSANSLADVAMYYYNTDLRHTDLGNCSGALGTDVCRDNVPGNTDVAQRSFGDSAAWQHMTTFTLGLGVSGLLNYDKNYLTQTTGDFVSILNRSKDWPVPGATKGAENTDDLWHAAVNGRGQYFSAGDPASLAASLKSAFDEILPVTGAAAAASTSSLQPVQNDNDVYVAQFTTQDWTGDVLAYTIDPKLGTISKAPTWSAQAELKTKAPIDRKIYYPKPNPTAGAVNLREFTFTNLSDDSYGAHFTSFCSKAGAGNGAKPAQCVDFNAAQTTDADSGANLVSYLRGTQNLASYRARKAVLGDIIGSSPLYVGKPAFKYTENNYATFASLKSTRQAVVLAGANDGMLHAFDRADGKELWAFIPSFVLPNLYKLADTAYASNHSFFVDGSPQMGDIYVGTGDTPGWKTIVVGGLNAGGRGYYALDVTDPANPKFLWEFRDTDLGLTFGNPIITKRADGTWVVVFTSGYNNVNTGDGNGHLYVLDANTGAQLTKISTMLPDNTAAGNSATPSGLAKLNVWVDDVDNNLAKRFYAGDVLGNLWRFDIDNLVEPHQAALQLAKFTSPDGTPQSITTKPMLAEVRYNGGVFSVVYVGTGRYLGGADPGNSKVQSMYAVKDPLTNTSLGTVRDGTDLVVQSSAAITTADKKPGRTVTASPVNWLTKSGWRMDFPVGGERVTVNPQLTLNTLTVASILPSDTACTVGGESFLYRFDILTGAATVSYVGNVLVQGLTTVQIGDGGDGSIVTITTRSDATLQTDKTSLPSSGNNLRRTSWRELAD